jgi:hypothetical protein
MYEVNCTLETHQLGAVLHTTGVLVVQYTYSL